MIFTSELGHFALIFAFVLAGFLCAIPFMNAKSTKLADNTAFAVFFFTLLAFICLLNAFYSSDFSVTLVQNHSHSQQALVYKLTSLWGNHEGSMLLWVLILTLFSAILALNKAVEPRLKQVTLAVQGLLSFAFIGFTLFTSNPFARLLPAPLEGKDLNPVLQDLGLAIHPPMLYVGYVGFSLVFSFAAAALLLKKIDSDWAKVTRPYVLLAWIFLTLGIAMGSYWAYYTLGWGGWWFWDPVENASLMPWLVGTALLHSIVVMEKRGALKIWTILLAILTFSFALLGTFLVRSGILTSVHSFASDPTRGLVILLMLVAFIGFALLLFATRVSHLKAGALFMPVSREGAIVFNNLFLTVSASAILFGTLYPLGLEAVADIKISVGAPYFNTVFAPLAVPLLIIMPIGAMLSWKKAESFVIIKRLYAAIALSFLVMVVVFASQNKGMWLAPILMGLGAYVVLGSLTDLWEKASFDKGLSVGLARLRGLPLTHFGMVFAHLGVGLLLIGVTGESFYGQERIETIKQGQSIDLNGKELRYIGLKTFDKGNFQEMQALIELREGGVLQTLLTPSRRHFKARNMQTTETALETHAFSQYYLTVASFEEGAIILRAYHKPLVLLIFIGAMVMGFGGLLSLIGRRK